LKDYENICRIVGFVAESVDERVGDVLLCEDAVQWWEIHAYIGIESSSLVSY
jgi:hypothetical protein